MGRAAIIGVLGTIYLIIVGSVAFGIWIHVVHSFLDQVYNELDDPSARSAIRNTQQAVDIVDAGSTVEDVVDVAEAIRNPVRR